MPHIKEELNQGYWPNQLQRLKEDKYLDCLLGYLRLPHALLQFFLDRKKQQW